MRRTLFGLFTYVEFFVLAFAFLVPLAVAALISGKGADRRLRGRWMRRFGRATSGLTPLWRFSVEGSRPADLDTQGYVVVCNHQSTADPFLLSWLPWDMRWVAKEELFRTPPVGWLMRLSGDVPVRRGDGESVAKMMAECRATLAAGMSVMVFPEGTRSPDGKLLPFKDGAFRLAIETGRPILPLALYGTRSCRPKGSLWFGDADAVVRALAPISTAGLTAADVPWLREQVRERISAAVDALAARNPGRAPRRAIAPAPGPRLSSPRASSR
jgi:1-acyl-sn-glycerol-3-phosphate acyltransferase